MKYWNSKPSRLPEPHRPLDWQDRLVIGASMVTGAICLALVVWGR